MKTIFTLVVMALLTSASVAQWSEQTSGVTSVLYSVSPIDNDVVWICGAAGKVLRTTNGGTNWIITSSPNASLDLYNIWGIDANNALVTGSSSTTYVYKTTNGGTNWTQVFTQSGGFIDAINGLSDTDPNQIFMYGDPVGSRWSIWKSTNGGSTWDSTGRYLPQAGSETGYNNAAYVSPGLTNDTRIWFGTNNTRVYKGDNNGIVIQPTTGQVNSLAIQFFDSLNGVVGGSTGMLFTSNGGTNWLSAGNVPGSGSINGFASGNGYGEMFYTRGTSVYYTSNSGFNWVTSTTQTGTYNHMLRARTSGNLNIWAIRSNGGISKYTSLIGIKPISEIIPGSFALEQNYPNPFNPKTIIHFQLPKYSNVKLVVYDILGKEVAVLVNEQLKPGKYEAAFNGSNYPSGVYFYKITAGDFSQTKRMILLK